MSGDNIFNIDVKMGFIVASQRKDSKTLACSKIVFSKNGTRIISSLIQKYIKNMVKRITVSRNVCVFLQKC